MNSADKALSISTNIKYATLATCGEDGSPWNSPVFCAYDDALNVYWSSHPDAIHSKNILRNRKVFIVVYDSTSEDGEGLYMECAATLIDTANEVSRALDLLGERRGKPFTHIEKFMAPGPQRIFKAVPVKMWINDADKDEDGDYTRDYRIPIESIRLK